MESEILKGFAAEADKILNELDEHCLDLEKNLTKAGVVTRVFGLVHTLKGSAGIFEPKHVHHFAHAYEDLLNKVQQGHIVVSAELVSTFKKFNHFLRVLVEDLKIANHSDYKIEAHRVSCASLVKRLSLTVAETASVLHKEVNFVVEGADLTMDSAIFDMLSKTLVHMVRNALDHGIEAPQMRLQLGKKPQGKLLIRFSNQNDNFVVEIQDDGAGINVEKVRETLIKKGLRTAEDVQKMSQEELQFMIFDPGFSTAQLLSDFSGRGIGMSVVKDSVEAIKGKIHIKSGPKSGSEFRFEIPQKPAR